MKISIDTKEDSIEDIRKVVALLSGIMKKEENNYNNYKNNTSNILEREDQPVASMFGMFDNAVKKAEEDKPEEPKIIQY